MSGGTFDFLLPDVGEGLEEAEILQWKVSVGDEVAVNQVIVEIESAKSLVELPSPYAGTVVELLVTAGQVVPVGTPIIRIQLVATEIEPTPFATPERNEILVGSGPRIHEGKGRGRSPRNYGPGHIQKMPALAVAPPASNPTGLAKPLVRKLARELGVDLTGQMGSGPEGSLTREDVQRLAQEMSKKSDHVEQAVDNDRESRVPIRGVRRAMAQAMVASAFTAPHVTEFVTVDVTAGLEFLDKLRSQPKFAGIRISPLTLLASAICIAARTTPEINSFWNEATQEIVTKHYVNLGIATATDRGLLVPNIKDAGELHLPELARAIADVVETARAGRLEPAQMSNGTISITNIGVFGIDSGTPILPPGESAIVALGAISERPWVVGGEIVIRAVTTLALSFDHRLIDGAQGSKFLSDIAVMLHDPVKVKEWI